MGTRRCDSWRIGAGEPPTPPPFDADRGSELEVETPRPPSYPPKWIKAPQKLKKAAARRAYSR